MIKHVIILDYSAPSVHLTTIDIDKVVAELKERDIYDPDMDEVDIVANGLDLMGFHLSNCEYMYQDEPIEITNSSNQFS